MWWQPGDNWGESSRIAMGTFGGRCDFEVGQAGELWKPSPAVIPCLASKLLLFPSCSWLPWWLGWTVTAPVAGTSRGRPDGSVSQSSHRAEHGLPRRAAILYTQAQFGCGASQAENPPVRGHPWGGCGGQQAWGTSAGWGGACGVV